MENKCLLTVIIPSYNAEKFLDISIPSVLNERIYEEKLMDKFEVIIIDDGSTDDTYINSKKYARIWNQKVRDNFVKVITKENGQYGSVINIGIKKAKGHFIKVLDVDDHLKVDAFIDFMYIINGLPKHIDIIITDFIYEKVGTNKSYVWSFSKNFENCQIIDTKTQSFPRELITMHSLVYRTDFLREINYKQIEKVYYSDSQYALIPFQHAKSFYYINLCLYGYYIGRDDQSINIKVMVKNSEHQLKVFEKIFDEMDLDIVNSKNILKYLILNMRAMIQWRILLIAKDRKIKNKRLEILNLIKHIKIIQPKYSKRILNGILFKIIFITNGFGVASLVNLSIRIYNIFRNNIFAD